MKMARVSFAKLFLIRVIRYDRRDAASWREVAVDDFAFCVGYRTANQKQILALFWNVKLEGRVMERRRIKHIASLEERLVGQACRLQRGGQEPTARLRCATM